MHVTLLLDQLLRRFALGQRASRLRFGVGEVLAQRGEIGIGLRGASAEFIHERGEVVDGRRGRGRGIARPEQPANETAERDADSQANEEVEHEPSM